MIGQRHYPATPSHSTSYAWASWSTSSILFGHELVNQQTNAEEVRTLRHDEEVVMILYDQPKQHKQLQKRTLKLTGDILTLEKTQTKGDTMRARVCINHVNLVGILGRSHREWSLISERMQSARSKSHCTSRQAVVKQSARNATRQQISFSDSETKLF